LIVDADAPCATSIAVELFQPISRRDAKIVQPSGHVQLFKLAPRHSLNIGKASNMSPSEQILRVTTAEGLNGHGTVWVDINALRY
jgi:hypothetical protein